MSFPRRHGRGRRGGGQCCTMAYTHAYAHRSTRAHTHNGARLTAAQHNKSDKFMSRSRCGPLSWATQLQRWPVADENRRAKLHRATAETRVFCWSLSLSRSSLQAHKLRTFYLSAQHPPYMRIV